MGNTQQKEKMLEHVTLWKSSGLNQAAYAKQEDINVHNFRYWIKKDQRGARPFDGFVHIGQVPATEISLRYPNGVELYLPAHTPARTMLELIKA